MKKILIAGILFFTSHIVQAQAGNTLVPYVDKRVELISIAFRMADENKMKDTLNPFYTKAINEHFAKYKDHPLIHYTRKITDSLRNENTEPGDWDIAGIAVHLSPPPSLQLLPLSETGEAADVWESKAFLDTKLVPLLQQFYKEANCEAFFSSQEKYYQSVSMHYKNLNAAVNRDWLKHFFNIPVTEEYFPIIGLNMRNGAYLRANLANRKRQTFTIFACNSFGADGIPRNMTDPVYERNILHEYIHAFTNQLIDNNKKELLKSAEILLNDSVVSSRVKNTFYNNPEYLLYESLVRACTIIYRKYNSSIFNEEKEMQLQEKAGFLRIKELVNELERYRLNRNRYRSLQQFMPEMILFFKRKARI